MNDILTICLYSCAAGLPIILGGMAASLRDGGTVNQDGSFNRWIIAFGGGALAAAIAFALVPRAMELLPTYSLVLMFIGGTVVFMGLDILISQAGTSLAQALSMMMDFIPEALALGASFAHDHRFGLMLAVFIGLQNLPEGYNSFFELHAQMPRKRVLIIMLLLSFIGIIAALLGFWLLSDRPALIAGIMLFAAGGIIYLIFQDIAPLSKKPHDWIPATGGSVGFMLGMVGEKLMMG